MKKNNLKLTISISLALVAIAVLFVVRISQAQSPTKTALQDLRREAVQVKREAVKENAKNILQQVKDVIKEKIKKQIKGKLVAIAGNILTVQNDQATFTVTTTDKTQLKRRFGALSTLNEFKPNDQLVIIGNRAKNTDGTISSTDIEASYIRNMSIQRRFAVFNGEVKSISGNTIMIQTRSRGIQTVNVSVVTQYKEKNTTISLSNLTVGDNLIVKGELWDRVSNIIDAKTILKLAKKIPTITPVEPTQTQN